MRVDAVYEVVINEDGNVEIDGEYFVGVYSKVRDVTYVAITPR